MARYRRKPIVVDAEQWFRVEYEDLAYKLPPYRLDVGYFRRPDVPEYTVCSQCLCQYSDHGWIDTLEGGHVVCPGGWIVTGVKNERYPVKPHIFPEIYERVEQP